MTILYRRVAGMFTQPGVSHIFYLCEYKFRTVKFDIFLRKRHKEEVYTMFLGIARGFVNFLVVFDFSNLC